MLIYTCSSCFFLLCSFTHFSLYLYSSTQCRTHLQTSTFFNALLHPYYPFFCRLLQHMFLFSTVYALLHNLKPPYSLLHYVYNIFYTTSKIFLWTFTITFLHTVSVTCLTLIHTFLRCFIWFWSFCRSLKFFHSFTLFDSDLYYMYNILQSIYSIFRPLYMLFTLLELIFTFMHSFTVVYTVLRSFPPFYTFLLLLALLHFINILQTFTLYYTPLQSLAQIFTL